MRLVAAGLVLGLIVAGATYLVARPSASSQGDVTYALAAGWNNVAYQGDELPIEVALNDAIDAVETVWAWQAESATWQSWTAGAPDELNDLDVLPRNTAVWVKATEPVTWTILGATLDEGGTVGVPGPEGPEGPPGPAGLNCWDLDGDGVFDVDTEDQDGDAAPSAMDCQGPAGPRGPAGALNHEVVVLTQAASPTGRLAGGTVSCPGEKEALGGGFDMDSPGADWKVEENHPTADGRGWVVLLRHVGGELFDSADVFVVCAGPESPQFQIPTDPVQTVP